MTCYIIAEAGSNHDGDRDRAHQLIDIAAAAGADAVKFQLFSAEQLYPRTAGRSDYLASERSIYDVVHDLELPPAWLAQLSAHCAARGIDFLATPFDEASADLVDPYVSAHKCASYELTHHPLLRRIAGKGKRLYLSTGTATLDEVAEAVRVVERTGNRDLVLLQCTASYPTPIDQANVLAMRQLADAFGYPVGLSDHTLEPTIAPTAAVALGACVVEKHFTHDRGASGPDHEFALELAELTQMVAAIRATERVLGHGRKEPLPVEQELRAFARRAIFTRTAIRRGETLSRDNTAVLRCGTLAGGLAPSAYPELLGRRAARDLAAEVGICHDDVTD